MATPSSSSWPDLPVNFPPVECSVPDIPLSTREKAKLDEEHQRFDISPRGNNKEGYISDTKHVIPYGRKAQASTTSDADPKPAAKAGEQATNDLHSKLGLTELHTIKYTFKHNGTHTVIWDYVYGYVRITPFFKALGLGKVAPKAALDKNRDTDRNGFPKPSSGLAEICPSITGGALIAQGYWMDWHCARELCTTFCYEIRYALTPVFGVAFVNDCRENSQRPDKYELRPRTLAVARHRVQYLKPLLLSIEKEREESLKAKSRKTTKTRSASSKKQQKQSRYQTPDSVTHEKSEEDSTYSSSSPTTQVDARFSPMTDIEASTTVPAQSTITWTSINRPRVFDATPTTQEPARDSMDWKPSRSASSNNHSMKRPVAAQQQVSVPTPWWLQCQHGEAHTNPAAKRLCEAILADRAKTMKGPIWVFKGKNADVSS